MQDTLNSSNFTSGNTSYTCRTPEEQRATGYAEKYSYFYLVYDTVHQQEAHSQLDGQEREVSIFPYHHRLPLFPPETCLFLFFPLDTVLVYSLMTLLYTLFIVLSLGILVCPYRFRTPFPLSQQPLRSLPLLSLASLNVHTTSSVLILSILVNSTCSSQITPKVSSYEKFSPSNYGHAVKVHISSVSNSGCHLSRVYPLRRITRLLHFLFVYSPLVPVQNIIPTVCSSPNMWYCIWNALTQEKLQQYCQKIRS